MLQGNFLILINATKRLNPKCSKKLKLKPLKFAHKSAIIKKDLQALSLKELMQNYGITKKLAQKVYAYWHQAPTYCYAYEIYDGLFFQEAKLQNYDPIFLEKHLRIVDAYYGLLNPFDLISPYRLDFHYQKLAFNLYQFWNQELTEELKNYQLYSLLSHEYEKVLKPLKLNNLSPLNPNKINIKKLRGQTLKAILEQYAKRKD